MDPFPYGSKKPAHGTPIYISIAYTKSAAWAPSPKCWFNETHWIVLIQPAENARAVTGIRCPHSGVGEDFLARRPFFFNENGRFLETKKSHNRSEGEKLTVSLRATG